MKKSNRLISLSIALIIGLFALGLYFVDQKEQRTPLVRTELGGDFTLQSVQGPVSLRDFKGNPVLIYFGFTSCPDICPTSLAVIREALKRLSDEQRSRVNALFISVDPDRDSLEYLEEYSRFFSPQIIGLTGTKTEIDRVVEQYGAYYRFVELEDSALGYTVDHSSRIYLIDSSGEMVETLPHNSNPELLTQSLNKLL